MARIAHIDKNTGTVLNIVEGPVDMRHMPPPPDGAVALMTDEAIIGHHYDGKSFHEPEVSIERLLNDNHGRLILRLHHHTVTLPDLGAITVEALMRGAVRQAAQHKTSLLLPRQPPEYGYIILNVAQVQALDQALDAELARILDIYRRTDDAIRARTVTKHEHINYLP